MQLKTTIIQFPEIRLATRDGHKLRGFFGNLFREHSELLHNHFADGRSRFRYPLVQYKVIGRVPHLIGVQQGGTLLVDLFLKIKFLNIEGKEYPVLAKNITNQITEIGDFSALHEYRFRTLWMGLNQSNFSRYIVLTDSAEKQDFLNRQLQNNILSFYKGVNFTVNEPIMARADLREKQTFFKNKRMLAFSGRFVSNAVLPPLVGIGKSVARGFGTTDKI